MDPMLLPENRFCSIARTLEVLGQKWSLLLLRESFFGRTRFAEFERIGIPSGTLGARLDALVAAGLLERRAYRAEGERTREEYLLTPAGRDTIRILAALVEWGDAHLPLEAGPSIALVSAPEGRPVRLGFLDDLGEPVAPDAVAVRRTAPHRERATAASRG